MPRNEGAQQKKHAWSQGGLPITFFFSLWNKYIHTPTDDITALRGKANALTILNGNLELITLICKKAIFLPCSSKKNNLNWKLS